MAQGEAKPGHEESERREPATVLRDALERQRTAFLRDGTPSYSRRIEVLDRLKGAIVRHREDIAAAIISDFGAKSWHETMMAEVVTTLSDLRYTKKRLKGWMEPQRRHMNMAFRPGKAKVIFQPKGVVGIVAPWNYPFYLAAVPMTAALAAGNRVMLKPSEITPATAALLKRMIEESFEPEEIAVFTGGPEVGQAFSRLPFDHLFFTGSAPVGRVIMRAAADHLTPVTLELGGKCPVIIHREYPLERAAKRIIFGKYLNGGQSCVAPDYVLVHEDRVQLLVQTLEKQIRKSFPSIRDNPDYTAVINQRHYDRLQGYVRDAREKGAAIVEVNPADEALVEGRKIPPTLVLDATDDMAIMREEIFGPLLPIKRYRELDEALNYVNSHPRPLALYYFDNDKGRADDVLNRTFSGGACINEVVVQIAQDDLPFGGLGESGIGAYHGSEGFETFSHKKGVVVKGGINTGNLLLPPYGRWVGKVVRFLLRG